jgi:excisionase family DNA binding protein
MVETLPDPAPAAEFCSTREAAVLLGVSIKTAQLWVENGVLQAWKTPGGHRRIRRDSVDAMLRKRQQDAGAPLPAMQRPQFSVLIVDDDPQMRRLYEMSIGYWELPIRVIAARNGFEGLVRIGEDRPDLLITDLHMPGMDGFRMIAALHGSPPYEGLRIVVASGLSAGEIRARGGLPDGIPFFTKPIPFERLRTHVEELIKAR